MKAAATPAPPASSTATASASGRELGLLGALLPAWLALAWLVSKAAWFWQHNPELQFGWVMLLLCGYLIFEAWEKRPEPTWRWTGGGVLGAMLGCGLLALTQIYQAAYGMTAASMSGLAVGVMLVVAANISAVFGWRGVRHFAFSFAFIVFALPIPSVIYGPIVMGLQSKVASINVEVLNLIGIPAQQTGSLIHLPNGTVGIDEACSGVRSLQSTVMATLFIGYLTLRTRTLQIGLLALGIFLAVFGNLVRSLFLSIVANQQGTEAVQKFHDGAGWSILLFTAVGVAGTAALLARAEKSMLKAQDAARAKSAQGS